MILLPLIPLPQKIILIISILLAFFLLMVLLFKAHKTPNVKKKTASPARQLKPAPASASTVTRQDVKAIAGDDLMTTELDLARAYLELGKKKLAQQILDHVMANGNAVQQEMAKNLHIKLVSV